MGLVCIEKMSHRHHRHQHNHGQGSGTPYYPPPSAPGYGAAAAPAYYAPGPQQQQMLAPAFGNQSYSSFNNAYGSGAYPPPYGGNSGIMAPVQGLGGAPGMYQEQQYQQLVAEEHRHKQHEHRAGVAALGAAAFAAVSFLKTLNFSEVCIVVLGFAYLNGIGQ